MKNFLKDKLDSEFVEVASKIENWKEESTNESISKNHRDLYLNNIKKVKHILGPSESRPYLSLIT